MSMDESQSIGSLTEPLSAAYPATSNWIYLDSATRGLLPASARKHAHDYLDAHYFARTEASETPWANVVRDCVENFARMIGAQAREVGLFSTLSGPAELLSKVVKKLRGGNIIICPELTRPDIILFARHFAFLYGFKLVVLRIDGETSFPLHRLSRMVDDQTAMVLLPAVSNWRGWRLPSAKIAAICRKQDAFFLVDCSSSIGIIESDVAGSAVDGLLVAPRGNALGTQGICFLFVDALKLPSDPGLEAGFESVAPPNLFGQQQHIHFIDLLTAEAALKAINLCEVSCIEKHACGLAAQLRLVFEEIGMPLDNPLDASCQSHVVAVGLPSPLIDGLLDSPLLKGLSEKLKSGRVRFTNCRGQLQFSFHLYNRLQDVLDIRRVVTQ